MKEVFEQVSILGVRVDIVTLDELLEYVMCIVQDRKKEIIVYVNVHTINIAQDIVWFRKFLNHSQVVFCDGFGVKWAAHFLSGKELQRFTPPDWFGRLAEKSTRNGISLFFLGTRQEVVEKAATVLKETYPELRILGVQNGYFDKAVMSSENQAVLTRINSLEPDILVVGFGMPMQEKWILENWENLNVRVVLPVGAYFDYLAGDVARAPRWMTDHGLEWLGRLLIEPRRLWKRYIIGNPIFIWRILLQKLKIRKFDIPKQ
jgi:N-acetylglucosaminyldiphosphoundecaprenol N-acetyl-beta-D-mannosaminyltransferase